MLIEITVSDDYWDEIDPKVSINGSPPLYASEVNQVIKAMVQRMRLLDVGAAGSWYTVKLTGIATDWKE